MVLFTVEFHEVKDSMIQNVLVASNRTSRFNRGAQLRLSCAIDASRAELTRAP